MLKKILFIIMILATFGQNLYSVDYYNYGQWSVGGKSANGVGGYVDTEGTLGEKGKEYIVFSSGKTGYIYQVNTNGDPQKHPDNPNSTGAVGERTFTFISSHIVNNCAGHTAEFHIDNTGIYHGASCGIKRWDFDWTNESTIVNTGKGETLARNTRTGEWWTTSRAREAYKWDGDSWIFQFRYPNLGGNHHDGMDFTNDTLFFSDMTSDKVAIYKLDTDGNVISPLIPDYIYSYSATPSVEGMGFGPNQHLWASNGVIYEIGGGKLQEELSTCSQELTISDKWEMLSSKCDIKNATGFTNATIMKMLGDKLVVITNDTEAQIYYSSLGYDVNNSLNLSRGEGFWIRSKTDGIHYVLTGEEITTTIYLKKDTTRFIGLPDYHTLNLDEIFADKPVKEVRYWDSNISMWQKWQPNHVDTDLSTIINGDGFYICVADDFDMALPNLAPVAKIIGDRNISIGETVYLDGFTSFDRDGTIVKYEWREGNNTLSTSNILEKSDFELGWHKIILTVTDDDGAEGIKEIIVLVEGVNKLPTVYLGEDHNISEGESVTLTPKIYDADGYILAYEWKVNNTVVSTTPYFTFKGLSLGEHNITVEVIDSDLGHASDSIFITVNPVLDTIPPVITVLGESPTILILGDNFIDKGAVAIDEKDGNVSIDSNGSVDINQAGTYTIYYNAQDQAGNTAYASRMVIVQEALSNTLPTVDAGDDQTITREKEITLSALADDSDGSIVKYEWKQENESVGLNPTIIVNNLDIGIHIFTLVVTDNLGGIASDSLVVKVVSKDEIDTIAPIINILGSNPHILNIGEEYNDLGAIAIDDKDGKVSVSTSHTIDTYTSGVYIITYMASDKTGNQATSQRSVLVQDVNNTTLDTIPPVISILGDNPLILIEGEIFNDPGVIVVDNRDGQIGYSINHNINSNRIGSYFVTYSAKDNAGNMSSSTRKVYIKDILGNKAPIANAGVDRVIAKDTNVKISAILSRDLDGDIISYIWKSGDTILSTEESFQKSDFDFGSHEIILEIVDNDGLSSSDTLLIRVLDPSDITAPIAGELSPTTNSTVTFITDIIGTASDENLDYYELLISSVGQEEYTTFATGTDSVTNDVLGVLDPTTMQNGLYDIVLEVTDLNGETSTSKTQVSIEGKAKIGNFSFTVTDFDLQVGGLPVQVNRTYSTLQRNEKLDFGYAWSIDYQNVKLQENIHPARDWKVISDTTVGFCFKFDKSHQVSIFLPDGTTEKFEYRFAKECAGYNLGSFYDAPKLYALNGSEAKLETLDASESIMMDNSWSMTDGNSLMPYNPNHYRLTLSNGMVYDIKQDQGLTQVKDIRGDTLTYTDDGIESSRGESLTFTRDSQDRITSITDLSGRSMTYVYDANDNLESVIDQLKETTKYTYQEGHLLEEYFAPNNFRVTKNIYDDSGRLIKTIDADKNVVEFSHDIEGRQEIIKDKLGRPSVFSYDDEGNVLSVRNVEAEETTSYTYDEKGNELTVTDPLGNTITNEYDSQGNLLSTRDDLGNFETTTYNDKNAPTSISDKNKNTMEIVYNAYNSPKSFTTASGATNTYSYDKFGNKIQSINEYNQTTFYEYDEKWVSGLGAISSKGKLLKETQPNGTIIQHTYDANSNLLSTTSTTVEGAVTTTSSTYDAFDRLITSTDSRGHTSTNTYDTRGNKVSTRDGQQRTTTYTYNNHNKIIKTLYPDGTSDSKTYDAMDNILSETNADEETTTYEYDDADRLIKTTYADNTSTSNTYDKAGRTLTSTDQNTNTTTYEYDIVGNQIKVIDALTNETIFTYDANGNRLEAKDANKNVVKYRYDVSNNLVETLYMDDTNQTSTYDISGRKTSSTNQNNITTYYSYDEEGRLSSVKDAFDKETFFTYDSQGNKLTQKDAKKRTTQWAYNKYGQEISRILPLKQTESITYDAYGKVATKTDFNKQTTSYIYDSNDRIQSITYADGQKEEFVYNDLGQTIETSMTIGIDTFTTEYSYNNTLGRLSKEIQPSAAILEYEYDSVGNLLTFTLTNANNEVSTTQYQYDTLNRLKTVISPQGEPTNYSYDDVGNLQTVTHANGNKELYSYDRLNRLLSLTHQDKNAKVLASFAYTLSPSGQRVEIVEDNRSTSYSYDDLSRVISEEISDAKNGDYTSSYTYDKVSNRIESTIDGVTTQYDYDDNDRLLQQGGTVYTYDEQGNTLSQTLDYNTTSYSYNAKNQLIEVVTDSDTITYSYNLKGIRTAKNKSDKNIQYIIDSNQAYAQVVQEIEDDTLAVSYTYGHDLLSQTRQNKTYDYHYDGLGSARYLSDENGIFTDSYNYEAFGKLLNTEGNTTNNYKFTGEQLDEETQNYYLRSRYFSPLRGGFTQQDSYMGNGQDPVMLHKYLYGNGNPVMNIDPSGYYSMAEVSSAMGVRNSLQNMQMDTYFNIGDIMTSGEVDFSGIPIIARYPIGRKLLSRFQKKFEDIECNSFDGLTLVYTNHGLQIIQDIRIGDKVWAYNEKNQTQSLQEVTHLIRGEGNKKLVDIELKDGEVITATSKHPFWEIDSQKWLDAENLTNSSVLLNVHDENTTIKSLKHYTNKKNVYNLTIANFHTYYVGLNGILGHNCKFGFSKNWGVKTKKHFREIRQSARELDFDMPDKYKHAKSNIDEFAEYIILNGERKNQKYMTINNAIWSKYGDSIIIQDAKGTVLTHLLYSQGGAASFWGTGGHK